MKKYFKYLILFLISSTQIVLASSKGTSRSLSAIESYLSNAGYKGVILLANRDSIILKRAYGFANLEYSIPNNTNTVFNLASLTKHFTASAILMLEEKGMLSVTDTIKQYIPQLSFSKQITIHHLLTHTSGVPNYNNFNNYSVFSKLQLNIHDVIRLINDHQLEFTPGTDFNYSNSNYAILAYIIEKVGGLSYAEFLHYNIFEKVGMYRTGNYSRKQIIVNRAETYIIDEVEITKAEWFDYSFKIGSASLFSTVNDLYKWYKGLVDNKILSDSSFEKMLSNYGNGYGYGLGRGDSETEFYEHEGISPGVCNYIAFFKEPDYCLIMLSNYSDNKFFQMRDIIRKIILSQKQETQ